jgi:hypothetical protein
MRATLGVLIVVGAMANAAHAGPTARFGLTGAIVDQGSPGEHELGPNLAVGWRLGGLVVEGDYAFLSFMDPDYGPEGVHRFGASLRGDLWRSGNDVCRRNLACTRSNAVFIEAGVAKRYGEWRRDRLGGDDISYTQREVHAGIGLELDNRVMPYRLGWQVALRFAVAPGITDAQIACRGVGCPSQMGPSGGTEKSVLLEWTFLVGH